MEAASSSAFTRNLNTAVPLAVVGVVLIMILPVPPPLLDVLIFANIMLSVIALIVTMHITRPTRSQHLSIFAAADLGFRRPHHHPGGVLPGRAAAHRRGSPDGIGDAPGGNDGRRWLEHTEEGPATREELADPILNRRKTAVGR